MNESVYESYPLQWPDGYRRTARRVGSRFGKHTLYEVRNYLRDEVDRLGGRKLVISTNMKTRNDGDVYSNAKEPSDSGVAIYFERKGKSICIPCDTYSTVWENTYAIARGISAMRQIERDGIPGFLDRAFTGFVALPAPGDNWRAVLGIDATAGFDAAKAAYRRAIAANHPDSGGREDRAVELNQAWEAAQRHFAAKS